MKVTIEFENKEDAKNYINSQDKIENLISEIKVTKNELQSVKEERDLIIKDLVTIASIYTDSFFVSSSQESTESYARLVEMLNKNKGLKNEDS